MSPKEIPPFEGKLRVILMVVGAAFGWWLANTELITRVTVEHKFVLTPIVMPRVELPSRLEITLFGIEVYEATGSVDGINTEAKSMHRMITVLYVLIGIFAGGFANAVFWNVTENRKHAG